MICTFLYLDGSDRPTSHAKSHKHLVSLLACQRKWEIVKNLRQNSDPSEVLPLKENSDDNRGGSNICNLDTT